MGCLYYNNINRILPHGWYLTTETPNPDGHGAINSIMSRSSHSGVTCTLQTLTFMELAKRMVKVVVNVVTCEVMSMKVMTASTMYTSWEHWLQELDLWFQITDPSSYSCRLCQQNGIRQIWRENWSRVVTLGRQRIDTLWVVADKESWSPNLYSVQGFEARALARQRQTVRHSQHQECLDMYCQAQTPMCLSALDQISQAFPLRICIPQAIKYWRWDGLETKTWKCCYRTRTCLTASISSSLPKLSQEVHALSPHTAYCKPKLEVGISSTSAACITWYSLPGLLPAFHTASDKSWVWRPGNEANTAPPHIKNAHTKALWPDSLVYIHAYGPH